MTKAGMYVRRLIMNGPWDSQQALATMTRVELDIHMVHSIWLPRAGVIVVKYV